MRIARRICLATIITVIVGIGATGAWLWHSGYRAYVVHTGSMSPTYKPGSLVIDKAASGNYHRGEVITFRHSALTTDVVTHRITDVTSTGLIHTKGDGNATADVWDIRPNQDRGSVRRRMPFAGFVVVYLQQPAGRGLRRRRPAGLDAALGALVLRGAVVHDGCQQGPGCQDAPGGGSRCRREVTITCSDHGFSPVQR